MLGGTTHPHEKIINPGGGKGRGVRADGDG